MLTITIGFKRALLDKLAYVLIKLFIKVKLLFNKLPLDTNLVCNTVIKYLIRSSSNEDHLVNDTHKNFIFLLYDQSDSTKFELF